MKVCNAVRAINSRGKNYTETKKSVIGFIALPFSDLAEGEGSRRVVQILNNDEQVPNMLRQVPVFDACMPVDGRHHFCIRRVFRQYGDEREEDSNPDTLSIIFTSSAPNVLSHISENRSWVRTNH